MKIYTRGSKIWVTLYQDGKRIRKATGLTDTKANKKQVERELLPLLDNTNFSQKNSVGYYFDKLMFNKKLKEGTIRQYLNIYNTHIVKYEDYQISDVDVKFAREWTASIKVKASTLRGVVNIFSQIADEAVYDFAINDNPFKKVRLPKVDKYEPEPFSDEEAKKLLNNANGWFKNFLGFSLLTGMRTGEVCALMWSDIGDKYINVSKSR